ncbi:hypothetical protein D3C75_722770 [compost metagenome]
MNAPVQQHAAALGLHMPPVARNAVGSMHTRFKLEQCTNRPVVIHFFDDAEVLIPPPVLMDHKHTSGRFGSLGHFIELFRGQSNRLLADDMLACSECRNGDFLVHVVRCCNQYGFDLRICQDILIAGISGITRCLRGTAAILQQVERSGHLQATVLLNQLCVIASHSAIAYNDD